MIFGAFILLVGWRCLLQLRRPYPTFTGCKRKIYKDGKKSPQSLVAVGKDFFGEGEFCQEKSRLGCPRRLSDRGNVPLKSTLDPTVKRSDERLALPDRNIQVQELLALGHELHRVAV